MAPNSIIYGLMMALAVWIGAMVIEVAARVFAQAYSALGTDLPALTLWMIDLTRATVPWLWAISATALLGYAFAKQPTWVPGVAVAVLALTVLGLAFAVLAFVEPVVQCGDYWPAWPVR